MTAHYYCLLYDIVIYLSCKPIILLDGSYSLLLHIQPIFSRPSAPHKKLLYSENLLLFSKKLTTLCGAVVVTSLAPHRLGQNQLVPFGRPSWFRADPEQLRKPKSLALSYLRTFFSVPAHCWGMGRGWGGRIRWGWRNRRRGMARRRRDLGGRDGAVRLRRSEMVGPYTKATIK